MDEEVGDNQELLQDSFFLPFYYSFIYEYYCLRQQVVEPAKVYNPKQSWRQAVPST